MKKLYCNKNIIVNIEIKKNIHLMKHLLKPLLFYNKHRLIIKELYKIDFDEYTDFSITFYFNNNVNKTLLAIWQLYPVLDGNLIINNKKYGVYAQHD